MSSACAQLEKEREHARSAHEAAKADVVTCITTKQSFYELAAKCAEAHVKDIDDAEKSVDKLTTKFQELNLTSTALNNQFRQIYDTHMRLECALVEVSTRLTEDSEQLKALRGEQSRLMRSQTRQPRQLWLLQVRPRT